MKALRRSLAIVGTLAAATAASSSANASIVTYTDRSTWLAALGQPVTTQSFDAYPATVDVGPAVDLGGFLAGRQFGPAEVLVDGTPNGTPVLQGVLGGTVPDSLSIATTAHPGLTGFGFDIYPGSHPVLVQASGWRAVVGGTIYGEPITVQEDGAFVGFVATDGDWVHAANLTAADISPWFNVSLDNVSIAAVPEPASLAAAVVVVGTCVASGVRRRRSR